MNVFNIYHSLEQKQRIENDRAALEESADRETDLYNRGQFLALIGTKEPEAELWHNLSYRSGWLNGVGEYYDKKFGVASEIF